MKKEGERSAFSLFFIYASSASSAGRALSPLLATYRSSHLYWAAVSVSMARSMASMAARYIALWSAIFVLPFLFDIFLISF